MTAWRYPDGNQGSAPDQILVFGGPGGRADWVAADAADITTTRRTHFFDINAITPAQVDTVLDAADNSGANIVSAMFGSGQLAALLAST